MKSALVLSMLLGANLAQAESFPELYCVSTKSFQNVNQINLFTNKKGTMRISLQFYAVSDDGADAGNFDSAILQTVRGLDYDTRSGMISNTVGKLSLQVEKEAISPKTAEKIMNESKAGFDFENASGFKLDFKKYYKAEMVTYTLKGRKGYWDGSLMEAFKAGVTHYICGNIKDLKGRRPTFLDQLGGGDND